MISYVESFLCPDKQGTPEKGQVSTNNNKDDANSLKNQNQNNTHQTSSQKFISKKKSWVFIKECTKKRKKSMKNLVVCVRFLALVLACSLDDKSLF